MSVLDHYQSMMSKRNPSDGIHGVLPVGSKVALFLPNLDGGGAERVMVNLANGLADQGMKVDLVLAKAEGPFADKVDPGVRIIDLGKKNTIKSLPGLIKYLRKERPVALLSALERANVVALLAKRLSGVAVHVVVSVHNTLSVHFKGKKDFKSRVVEAMIVRMLATADGIVAVSAGVADDTASLLGISRDRVHLVYNPCVTRQLIDAKDELPNHPWFAEGQPPVILAVGRFTEQKDFPTLINAFDLARRKTNARLVILGEGPERETLVELIKSLEIESEVDLPGFSANPYSYMGHCGVFVLSSKWEGLPMVLVEAMACGAVVVSTDCPSGPRETLAGGKNGYLVPVGDVKALADAIVDALGTDPIKSDAASWSPFTTEAVVGEYRRVLYPGIKVTYSSGQGTA